MASEKTRELVRGGEELYQTKLKAALEPAHQNKFVAIDPDSGDYFLGDTLGEALDAAQEAYPDRLFYGVRVGHPAAVHMGVLWTQVSPMARQDYFIVL